MEGAFLFFVMLTVIGSLWSEYEEEALGHVEKIDKKAPTEAGA